MTTKLLFFLLICAVNTFAQTSLKLNEIMFFPVSGNNEFIEIYNTSITENVDLNGLKIHYYTASADIITDAGEGTILCPLSYAVIFEGDYDLLSGIYNNLVPADALILKIEDNAFGSTGMANTSDRPVWLLSSDSDTLDSYTYSADNVQSHSDEKVNPEGDSTQLNWMNSVTINGTPGFKNSVTPPEYDLCISSISVSPEVPLEGNDILIDAVIKNRGINTAGYLTVKIYNDVNLDSVPQISEQIYSQNYSDLIPNDSLSVTTNIFSVSPGDYNIIAKVLFIADEDTTNNTACKNFFVNSQGTGYNDVVINEIMYAPSEGEPEWVEIYSRTPETVNLRGWTFSDNLTTKIITNEDITLPPESFIVLTKDSSVLNYFSVPSAIIELNLPSLNNTGDVTVIKDSSGITVDSLIYSPDWGGNSEGRSLEKISVDDPGSLESSWSSSESIFKATPGRVNSITKKENDLKISSFLSNKDYGIIGEPVIFEIQVKNAGLNISSLFSLNLYYDINRDSVSQPSELVSTLNSSPLIPGDSITLNLSTTHFGVGINYFIVKLITSPDDDTTNNIAYVDFTGIEDNAVRNDLILNEFMYDPDIPRPEWIEIFNRSGKQINIRNYRIADKSDTVTFIANDLFLNPGTYAVIAKDTTIFNYFNVPAPVIIKSFPTLNNSGDKIILLDSLNRIIDSLEYSSIWGGEDGKSLEKIETEDSSAYAGNWSTSLSGNSGTPGYINSVTPKNYDVSVEDIIPSPRYPVAGSNVSLKVMVRNSGFKTANFVLNLFEDTNLDSLPDILVAVIPNLNLLPGDSLTAESGYAIHNLLSVHNYYAEAVFSPDMDTSNNHFIRTIYPGCPPSAIVINEIMYNPSDGEPEWVEILNISSDSINLKNWSLSDLLPAPGKSSLTGSDFYLQPAGFLVIARDISFYSYHPGCDNVLISGFGTMGNIEDGIVLYDFRDASIDSVHFKSKWGSNTGYSLERISSSRASDDSSNWTNSISPEKSTPGKVNSLSNIPHGIRNTIVINEIMADPDIDNCEFLEFYNNNTDSVNIGGWRIEDGKGHFLRVCNTSFFLQPGDYFLLSADSVIFRRYSLKEYKNISITLTSDLGLLNDGRSILLKDLYGNIIDSLIYSDDWHNKNINVTKNKSLERINPSLDSNYPENWSTSASIEGATPGEQNSIYADNNNKQSQISVSPNPFSPDNDGFEDFCIINFKLKETTSQIRIKIFDNRGRLVRTLSNNQPAGAEGAVVFDGLGDDGQTLRMGIYIVFLESLNSTSGILEHLKSVVVVARKL